MLVPKHKFIKYQPIIFEAMKREIETAKPKQTGGKIAGSQTGCSLEMLACVKYMFKTYGDEFNDNFDMVTFTNDLFYFGFNKQLIETLTDLAKICRGRYKGVT